MIYQRHMRSDSLLLLLLLLFATERLRKSDLEETDDCVDVNDSSARVHLQVDSIMRVDLGTNQEHCAELSRILKLVRVA